MAGGFASAARRLTPAPVRRLFVRYFDRVALALPRRLGLKLLFFKTHHYWPNFDDPKAYNEKLMALRAENPPVGQYADKVAVKDFVASIIGDKHIVPTLYSGETLPPREQRNWPTPFIIKPNNGSGGHIIVRDTPDWDAIDAQVRHILQFDYSAATGEQFYADIEPKILVEPLIGGDKLPIDYKFFAFDGEVALIQVNSDREVQVCQTYFDLHWNPLPLFVVYKPHETLLPRPDHLDEMVEVASKLSRGFAAVRVDLYDSDSQVWFSELTFTPGKALSRWDPFCYDEWLGTFWDWSKPFVPNAGQLAR